MRKGAKRHDHGRYRNEICRQRFDFIRSVINTREKASQYKHAKSHNDTAEYTESDHLVIGILGFLQISRSQILPNDNADAGSQLDIDDIKEICDRCRNIDTCHNSNAADGIALVDRRHTCCPQDFIDHKGQSLDKDCFKFGLRYAESPVGSLQIAVFRLVGMRP